MQGECVYLWSSLLHLFQLDLATPPYTNWPGIAGSQEWVESVGIAVAVLWS